MPTTRFIQINTNRSRAALDLVRAKATREKYDVTIICEQPANTPVNWAADVSRNAAIGLRGYSSIRVTRLGVAETDFTWMDIEGIATVFSCYFSPNRDLAQFTSFVDRLNHAVRATRGRLVIAGDFNAKSTQWGCARTCNRGRILDDWIASAGLAIVNRGNTWTYSNGAHGSIIDLTITNDPRSVRGWEVQLEESGSDHRYLTFEIEDGGAETPQHDDQIRRGWVSGSLKAEVFRAFLLGRLPPGGSAEEMAGALTTTLQEACDASMNTRRPYSNHRREVHWWNDVIKELRQESTKLRRIVQRKRRQGGADLLGAIEAAKAARKKLRNEIRRSKERGWRSLCDSLEGDPWGLAFRIVTNKHRPPVIPPGLQVQGGTGAIVAALFPTHAIEPPRIRGDHMRYPLVTSEEVKAAAARLRPGKAPGPDGLLNVCIKLAVEVNPDVFVAVFNKCLAEGCFPKRWKRAGLVLIPKPGKDPLTPGGYRPVSLLDSLGKLFEAVIHTRMKDFTTTASNQFGFQKGLSTLDAVASVMGTAYDSSTGVSRYRHHCIMVTLDVKNAFNALPWATIKREISARGLPEYVLAILDSYLCDRVLVHGVGSTQAEFPVTSGVPQGSVLGPHIWNLVYDGLLALDLPGGVSLVGFADDVAIVGRARELNDLATNLEEAAESVLDWMARQGLEIAASKTEVTVLSTRRGTEQFTLRIGDTLVAAKRSTRYLGVVVGADHCFGPHIDHASRSAIGASGNISRLMTNTSGLSQRIRGRLFNAVVTSRLLYGAPIWARGLRVKRNAQKLAAAQRLGAIRTARAYRTISTAAVLVLAGMVPVDILAEERAWTHQQLEGVVVTPSLKSNTKKAGRAASMQSWQNRWDASADGRWTHQMIGAIIPWANREHGDCSYQLTQLLCNHGSFGSYLHRIGRSEEPACTYCNEGVVDDAQHTLFSCTSWNRQREAMAEVVGWDALRNPGDLVPVMLRQRDKWAAVETFAHQVMRYKELNEPPRG